MALPANDKLIGDLGHTEDHNAIVNEISFIQENYISASSTLLTGNYLRKDTASATYATRVSPAFTGTPTAPTAASATNNTQIATTSFVRTAVSNLVASAPTTLDTLNELALALGNDPNFATTITNSLSTKLDSGTASSLYLTRSNASATYLSKTDAQSIYLPLSGSVNWSNINNKPDPVITLGGDLSGNVTLTDLGSGTLNAAVEKDFNLVFTGDVTGSGNVANLNSASIALTVAPNSVALGTDTTGNYVAGLTAGNGISITGTEGEGWSPTVSINSSTASVSFANITSKPTTLSGYGITDALPASASSSYGLKSGTLAQFSATTSSQLAGVISDETGTGSLVFSTSPALTTPNIGVATGTSFNSITGLSSTNPAMNGPAAVGTGTTVARADHVHPTDTTRAALSGATFTGTVITPAATTSISSIRIPHGTAPAAPINGDIWSTTSGLVARINNETRSVLDTSSIIDCGTP